MSSEINAALRVPTEVLSEIFALALQSDIWMTRAWDVCDESQVPTQMDTPWPFMLVCKKWHDVVSSDATLWSVFVVTIRQLESACDDVVRLPAIFENILRQSGHSPLTIKLAMVPSNFFGDVDENEIALRINTFTTLVRMAVDHCARWRDVLLHMDPGAYFHYHSGGGRPVGLGDVQLRFKDMPMLESLKIENRAPQTTVWTIGVELAPHKSLATLQLQGTINHTFQSDVSQLDLEAGFPCMRKLRVVSNRVNDSFGIMWKVAEHSPNLQRLESRTSPGFIRGNPNLVPRLELTKLVDLQLQHVGLYGETIPKLSFPSLERLELLGMMLSEHMLRADLRDFLAGPGRSAKSLLLAFNDRPPRDSMSDSQLMDLIQPMHRLVSLTITVRSANLFGLPSTFLPALKRAFRKDEPGTAHQLTSLSIDLNARSVSSICSHYSKLVVAIHDTLQVKQRPFELRLDVQSDIGGGINDINYRECAEKLLKEDHEIRMCSDTHFRTLVNDKVVTIPVA